MDLLNATTDLTIKIPNYYGEKPINVQEVTLLVIQETNWLMQTSFVSGIFFGIIICYMFMRFILPKIKKSFKEDKK